MPKTSPSAPPVLAESISDLFKDHPPIILGREIAAALRVHVTTVSDWVKAGQFPPPLSVGGRVRRWRKSSILAFFAQAEREAVASAER